MSRWRSDHLFVTTVWHRHAAYLRVKLPPMILARTTFTLKFGQAKPAIALWKQIMDAGRDNPDARPMRLMSDLSGPNYNLVADIHLRGFTDLGPSTHVWMTHERIRELYPRFAALCESSTSELYHVEHQIGPAVEPEHIVEQMAFRLKFGQARPACVIWKRILDSGKTAGFPMRMFTDITGPSYMLFMDMSYRNMLEYGPHKHYWLTNETMKEAYQEFIPLCDSAERRLYTVLHIV